MKKLWCLNCKEEVNHVEIRPFDYNYEEIMEKLQSGALYNPEEV